MTEHTNIIRFPVERRPGAPKSPREMYRAYHHHRLRARELREQLGMRMDLPEEDTTEAELARLAMHVCDLVIATRDASGEEHNELVRQSNALIREYERVREGET